MYRKTNPLYIKGLCNSILYEIDNNLNYDLNLYYLCKCLNFIYSINKKVFNNLNKENKIKFINDILKIINNWI